MQASNGIAPKLTRRWLRNIRHYYILYLLFLPVFTFYLLFRYMPMGGIIIAFKDYSFKHGLYGSPWTSDWGFKHFIRFLMNGEFWRVFKNTIILAGMRIAVGFPAPILLALLFNEIKSQRYKKVLQTISYLPHFVSFVVVYAILYNFFSFDGFFNGIRTLLGQEKALFLGETRYYRWLFVGSALWKEIGWGAIIYLAALSRVSVELYEAAYLDGANRLQMMGHITLPAIRPIISIQLVLTMGGLFNVSFDQTLVMNNSMVSSVADVTSYYIYKIGLLTTNQFSYATAIGLFDSILALLVVLLTNYLAKKIDEEGGLW